MTQVGYAAEREGARAGRASVAAAFARSVQEQGLGRNLLFAGPVTEGAWYYYAQRDGLILSGADRLGSEDDIRALLQADLAQAEWDLVYAPASWNIQGSSERALWDFLPVNSHLQYQTSRKLRPVRKRARDLLAYWKLAALAVALGLSIAGALKYKSYLAARELESYRAKQRELEAARAAEAARVVHPWRSQPRALGFARACEEAAMGIKTFWPGGWNFTGMTCAGNSLSATWTRQPDGWREHLLVVHPTVTVDPTGQTGKLVLPLPRLPMEDESAPAERERLLQLQTVGQSYGYLVKTGLPVVPTLPPGKTNGKPDWKEAPWSLEGSYLPPTRAVELLDSNGFRITSIESRYTNGLLNWSMKGIQYVQN